MQSEGSREAAAVASAKAAADARRIAEENPADRKLFWFAALAVLVVAGAVVAMASLRPRRILLSGTPAIDCHIGYSDGRLRFFDKAKTVLSAPAFEWALTASPPQLSISLPVMDTRIAERDAP